MTKTREEEVIKIKQPEQQQNLELINQLDKIETNIKNELKQEQQLMLKLSSHPKIRRKHLIIHEKIKLEQQIQQTLTKYKKPDKKNWQSY